MENSYVLGNIARDTSSASSIDAQILKAEQEAGLTSDDGSDLTGFADQQKQEQHAAIQEQLAPIVEKQTAPKKTDPLGGDPESDKNNILVAAEAGVYGFMQSLANAGNEVVKFADEHLGPLSFGGEQPGGKVEKYTFADDWFPESDLIANRLTRGATQFLTGFTPMAAGLKGLSGAKNIVGLSAKGNALVGSAANFLAFDKDQTMLGHLVQDIPQLANPIAEAMVLPLREAGKILAGKPEDSPVAMRIKNTIDGLGFGVMSHYLWKGLTTIFAKKVVSEGVAAVEQARIGSNKPPAEITPTQIPPQGEMPKSTGAVVPEVVPPGSSKEDFLKSTIAPVNTDITKTGRGQLNLEPNVVDADMAVKQQIAHLSKMNEEKISKILGPSAKHADLKFAATQVKPEQILNKKAGEVLTDAELLAARGYNVTLHEMFKEARDLALKTGSEVDAAKAMQLFYDSSNMLSVVTHGSSKLGTSLNYLGIQVTGEEEAKFAHTYLELHDKEVVKDFLAKSAKMPDKAIEQMQLKAVFTRMGDFLNETYVGNLLFGVKTHATNFVSNNMNSVYTNVETAIASRIPVGKPVNAEKLKGTFTNYFDNANKDLTTMSMAELAEHQKAVKGNMTSIMKAHNSFIAVGEAKTTAEASAKEFADRTLNTLSAITDVIRATPKSAETMTGKSLAQIAENKEGFFDPSGWKMEPAINSTNYGFSNPTNKLQKIANSGIDIWGDLQRLGITGLDNADNFQKWVNYRGSLHAKAFRFSEMMGLDKEDSEKFITDFLNNPPANIVQEAKNEASYKTWTNPLQTDFAKRIDEVMKSKILGVQPLRFFWPFTKTPGNIAQFALDRSPVNTVALGVNAVAERTPGLRRALLPYTQSWQDAMIAGGAQKQMAMARLGLGNAIIGAAAVLAGQGFITGSGPSNPKNRKLMEDAGWQPYAVKIGDNYIPIKKFAPVGTLVGMGADAADVTRIAAHNKTLRSILHIAGEVGELGHAIGDEISPEDSGNLVGLMTWMVVNNSTPEMMADSAGKFFDAIASKDISKIAPMMAANATPLTGATNNFRKIQDKMMRVTDNDPYSDTAPLIQEYFREVKNKVPWLSDTLPARQNIWGQDKQYPQAWGPDIVSPFIGTKMDSKDKVTSELIRLGYIGPATNVKASPGEKWLEIGMPLKVIKTGQIGEPIQPSAQLDPFQYHRYVQLCAGEDLKIAKGQTLKHALGETIRSEEYASAKDQAQRLYIKKTINGFRKAATGQLLQEFPDLVDKLRASAADQQNALIGER